MEELQLWVRVRLTERVSAAQWDALAGAGEAPMLLMAPLLAAKGLSPQEEYLLKVLG